MSQALKVGVIGVGGIAGSHFPVGELRRMPNWSRLVTPSLPSWSASLASMKWH